MKPVRTLLMAVLLAMLGAAASHAATVVDFDAVAQITADTASTRGPVYVGGPAPYSSGIVDWSDTSPLFNANASNLQPIYGAYQARTEDAGSPVEQLSSMAVALDNAGGGANNRLDFGSTKAAAAVITLNGVILWDKTDFLNGGDSGSVQFDGGASSSLSINVQTENSIDSIRFVIRTGVSGSYNYYLSSIEAPSSTGTTTIAGNTVGLQWSEFDIDEWSLFEDSAVNLGFTVAPSFSAMTFSDVSGVGFLFEASRSLANNAVLQINEYQANLVPEPGSVALLGLGLGALVWRRRRA